MIAPTTPPVGRCAKGWIEQRAREDDGAQYGPGDGGINARASVGPCCSTVTACAHCHGKRGSWCHHNGHHADTNGTAPPTAPSSWVCRVSPCPTATPATSRDVDRGDTHGNCKGP